MLEAFAELFDYAGMFPPAALSHREALSNYRSYSDRWALGRFLCPASALLEHDESEVVVIGAELPKQFRAKILALECKSDEVKMLSADLRGRIEAELFFEPSHVTQTFLDDLAAHSVGLKLRFMPPPKSERVADVFMQCRERGLRIKLTQGLHHAFRSEEHGFFCLLLAAGLCMKGASKEEIVAALELRDAGNRWASLSKCELAASRELISAIGSCSYLEPLAEMSRLVSSASPTTDSN